MFNDVILFVGLVLWGGQYVLAGLHGWLTPAQMRAHFPNESILPLLWHGGIWYDFPLTFWLAWLVNRHPEWSVWQWIIALALGCAGSFCMHKYVYAPATLPNPDPSIVVTQEAHVQNGHVTVVGDLHVAFFGLMFGIVINEVLFAKDPSPVELWATGGFLIGLLFVGNHMVLGIIKELTGGPIEYRGEPLKNLIGWGTVGGGAAVALFVCLARGVYHLW